MKCRMCYRAAALRCIAAVAACLFPLSAAPAYAQCYPTSLQTFEQATAWDGTPVRSERSDPGAALGPVDASYVSLGYGGTIGVGFTVPVYDKPGPDIVIHEASGQIFRELAAVQVSADGIRWVPIGIADNSMECDCLHNLTQLDLAGSGLDFFYYIRITDMTGYGLPGFNQSLDGFDLTAVVGINCSASRVPVVE